MLYNSSNVCFEYRIYLSAEFRQDAGKMQMFMDAG